MPAEIDIGRQVTGSRPGDDDRFADDIADQMVARFGDFLFATDAKPLSLEDAGHLFGVPIGFDIPVPVKRRFHRARVVERRFRPILSARCPPIPG